MFKYVRTSAQQMHVSTNSICRHYYDAYIITIRLKVQLLENFHAAITYMPHLRGRPFYVYACLCKLSLLESLLHKVPFAGTFLVDLGHPICSSFPYTTSVKISLKLRINDSVNGIFSQFQPDKCLSYSIAGILTINPRDFTSVDILIFSLGL